MNNNKWKYKISIVGLGNYIMGDDGIGIHLIRYLKEEKLNKSVNLIEAGTGPLNYLEEISHSKEIIVVDAIKGGEKAGTIYELMLNDLKKSTVNDSHGFSLFDTVKTAQSMTGFPEKIQIYGIEPEHIYLHTELSKPVESAICQVKKLLIDYISRET